jgi:hypothetical protein
MSQSEMHEMRSRLNAHSSRIRVLQYCVIVQAGAIIGVALALIMQS